MSTSLGPLEISKTILVADRPKTFDLRKSLTEAQEVWVVTAFAHQTGWQQIRSALLESKADITLMSGIDFCQTEPSVLKDWISADFTKKKARACLFLKPPTFHPKVFLVLSKKGSFALIGSGNLSAGGLNNNVECFVYVNKASVVGQVHKWLNELAADEKYCVPIDASRISTYEAKYEKAAIARKALNKITKKTSNEILVSGRKEIKDWDSAVRSAKTYMKTKKYVSWYQGHRAAAKKIKSLLHYPKFDFSSEDWSNFYYVEPMGKLVHIWKDAVFRREKRLKKALAHLTDRSIPIANRIDGALVWGFKINGLSKILASSEPKIWPVLNSVTEKAARSFGYTSTRGLSVGEKYEEFARVMNEFVKDAGIPDMLALDCFLFSTGKALKA